MTRDIPHLPIVIGACIAAVIGYAASSIWAVIWLGNETMTGDIIGTWKSFAVAAFAFWIGSSSGGKAKEPAGTMDNPLHVAGSAPGHTPVKTTDDPAGTQEELPDYARG